MLTQAGKCMNRQHFGEGADALLLSKITATNLPGVAQKQQVLPEIPVEKQQILPEVSVQCQRPFI